MRILLVDDHEIFLEGLRNLLEDHGIQVVGAAHNAAEAYVLAQRLRPDVVLMDVQMPNQSGIEATRILKSRYPKMKIVMMTVAQNDEFLFESITAGASGYLMKGDTGESFLPALEELARGETPLSPGLAARILAEFSRRDKQHAHKPSLEKEPHPSLTVRQKQILQMVADGISYRDIAAHLELTIPTIKYHMSGITERLHLENRTQVIAYAVKHKLIESSAE